MDYLDVILGEGTSHSTSKGHQVSYKCPLCGDHKERLFINVDKKVFFCHHCQATGSIVSFISDYTDIAWKDALDIYRQYETYEIKLPESIEEEVYSKLIEAPTIDIPQYVYPLPEEMIFMDEARGKAGNEAWRYLKSRGISMDTAINHGIGYCAEGKYTNRLILPDFEDSEVVYWQARTWEPAPRSKLLKKFYRKVLNPSLEEYQIKQGIRARDKSTIVGNIDGILESRAAVLVEGKFDQLTIRDSGGCLHGKHMSDEQFVKIVRNKKNIDVVVVMMDGDAFANAISTADRLYRHFDEVLVCKLPYEADPNSLGARGCLNILNQAEKYGPLFKVKAQLKGWI